MIKNWRACITFLFFYIYIAESPTKEEDSTNIAENKEADRNDLKDIVTSTLSKKLKDLEVSLTMYLWQNKAY